MHGFTLLNSMSSGISPSNSGGTTSLLPGNGSMMITIVWIILYVMAILAMFMGMSSQTRDLNMIDGGSIGDNFKNLFLTFPKYLITGHIVLIVLNGLGYLNAMQNIAGIISSAVVIMLCCYLPITLLESFFKIVTTQYIDVKLYEKQAYQGFNQINRVTLAGVFFFVVCLILTILYLIVKEFI